MIFEFLSPRTSSASLVPVSDVKVVLVMAEPAVVVVAAAAASAAPYDTMLYIY